MKKKTCSVYEGEVLALDGKNNYIEDNGALRLVGVKMMRTGPLKYGQGDTREMTAKALEGLVDSGKAYYKPAVTEHPKTLDGMIPDGSINEYGVGIIAENMSFDGKWLKGDVIVTDGSAIKKVMLANQVRPSMGYYADVFIDGGGKRTIEEITKVNHLAILTPNPRAGGESITHLDDKGSMLKYKKDGYTVGNLATLDNLSIEYEEQSKDAIETLLAREDLLKTALKESVSSCDDLKGKAAALETENKGLKEKLENSVHNDDIEGIVAKRQAEVEETKKVSALAKDIGVSPGSSLADTKRACLEKAYSGIQLDDSSIEGAFKVLMQNRKTARNKLLSEKSKEGIGTTDNQDQEDWLDTPCESFFGE